MNDKKWKLLHTKHLKPKHPLIDQNYSEETTKNYALKPVIINDFLFAKPKKTPNITAVPDNDSID